MFVNNDTKYCLADYTTYVKSWLIHGKHEKQEHTNLGVNKCWSKIFFDKVDQISHLHFIL